MIIQDGKVISDRDDKINCINTTDYTVYYKGLIFVTGEKCGQDSIKYIVRNLQSYENFKFKTIFGNFFIYIIDHIHKRQFIFIDNSGIFKAYKYKDCISTSFLELVDYFDELAIDKLDYNSIAEFFHFGFTYFDKTLIKGINRIDANYFFIYENQINRKKEKGLSTINSHPEIKIENYFSDLIHAIDSKNLSIDLTGGFDSRLILSFFIKAKAKFELALSERPNNSDINIANKIAFKISKDFYPTFHSTENLDVKELYEIFERSDSQIDIIDYHRNNQLNYDRLSRKVEIQLSGIGGELYKDFWWLQDFPFYNKSTTNIERLYHYRIEGINFPHSILGENIISNSQNLKDKTIAKLKSCILKTNTQSYDNIYYNYKMKTNAGVYISTANNYFTSYAPLLELELVKIGFNLERRKRFFNNYHREIISNNCPKISRIRTTEGITSSLLLIDKLLDCFFYVIDKVKRLLKQILRKILKKTYLQETPTDNYIYSFWQSNKFFEESVDLLQRVKILADDIEFKKIPKNLIGKIITLRLLIERLKK